MTRHGRSQCPEVANALLALEAVSSRLLPAICLAMIACSALGQVCKSDHKDGIAVPISLAAGTVRTPPLKGRNKYYNIDIETRWVLSSDAQRCAMGFAVSPSDTHCKQPQILKAAWKVFDGDQLVVSGLDDHRGNGFDASKDTLTGNIGSFRAQKNHTYVIELTFLEDASALNVTRPCLLIDYPGFSF